MLRLLYLRSGYPGPFQLSVTAISPPPTDAFEARTPLSGANVTVTATTLGATVQTDEPNAAIGEATVWYSWTAPRDGSVYGTLLQLLSVHGIVIVTCMHHLERSNTLCRTRTGSKTPWIKRRCVARSTSCARRCAYPGHGICCSHVCALVTKCRPSDNQWPCVLCLRCGVLCCCCSHSNVDVQHRDQRVYRC